MSFTRGQLLCLSEPNRFALSFQDVCREETYNQLEVSVSIPAVKEEPARPNNSYGVKSSKVQNQTSIEGNRSVVDSKGEQMENDPASGEQKVLEMKDKILPCPRCNSEDTKFCYYNNYNVNQPRHFCRRCHRYWTAGGTMRNVPVGAGRRKNKHLASHYHRMVMSSDELPAAHVETPDLVSHQVLSCRLSDDTVSLKGNGFVLNFCSDLSHHEPMGTVLNLGDTKKNIEQVSVPNYGRNGDEPSSGSSVTTNTSSENELHKKPGQMEQEAKQVCCDGFPPTHHLQWYPGQPWSPGWNNVAAMAVGRSSSKRVYEAENGNLGPVQWNSLSMVAAPAFCASSIPFPFVPASYWSSMPGWAGGSWDAPLAPSNCDMSLPSTLSKSACSGNGSPTLGKHSRDANLQDEEKAEVSVSSQDTENYDRDESAKSSVWANLGFKLEPTTRGIYKAIQPKMEGKGHSLDAKQQVRQANPAALARSQMFQEMV